jgi:hypothetical protein
MSTTNERRYSDKEEKSDATDSGTDEEDYRFPNSALLLMRLLV